METSSHKKMTFCRPKDARNSISRSDRSTDRRKRAIKRREREAWMLAYKNGEIYNVTTIKH